jgi:hypothetical protein
MKQCADNVVGVERLQCATGNRFGLASAVRQPRSSVPAYSDCRLWLPSSVVNRNNSGLSSTLIAKPAVAHAPRREANRRTSLHRLSGRHHSAESHASLSKWGPRLFFLSVGSGQMFSANPDGSDLKVIVS